MSQWAATVSQPSVMAVCSQDQTKVIQSVAYGDDVDDENIAVVTNLQCEICGDCYALGSRNVREHERPSRVEHVMVLIYEGEPVTGAFPDGKPRLYAARDGSG